MKTRLMVFTLALTFNLASWADKPLPAALQNLHDQGLEVITQFPVSSNLTGWVVSHQGSDLIIYTTQDGQHLINGVVMDAQGQDLSAEHQLKWLPQPSWEDLNAGSFITETSVSTPEQTIYVFFDSECPFCRLAWQALQPYRQVGLEVRWIPVAYLQPASRNLAISLLQTPNTQQPQLLAQIMQDQQPNPPTNVNASSLESLQANMSLMQALGLNATPGWVWQDSDGKLHTHSGMVKLSKIAELTNLPAQKHTAPELMRFR